MRRGHAIALRLLAAATVAALVTPIVIASPVGPAYPPPGGVTLGSSGDIGRAGGLTWSYADIDMNLFNSIFWGAWNSEALQFAFDGAIDEAGETLVFDFTSDLAGGTMVWTGASDLRHFSGGSYITERLSTRLTVKTMLPDGSALALTDPTSVELDGDIGGVLAVPGEYKVNALLEARRGTTWTPVKTLYDTLSTDPACTQCIRTSVGFGYFYDLNLPPVANFTWDPSEPVERKPVTFNSTSTDPENRGLGQAWDLDNDGEFDDASGASATVTFDEPGNYTIGLRVIDDRGLSATVHHEIVVVDCSRGPVSDLLRNTVYPAVRDHAENTAYYLACDVAADQLGV